jgi:hypothetical protein
MVAVQNSLDCSKSQPEGPEHADKTQSAQILFQIKPASAFRKFRRLEQILDIIELHRPDSRITQFSQFPGCVLQHRNHLLAFYLT